MAKKLFDLTESSIEILKNRDSSLYRHEYQYVEAAIQYFAQHEEKKEQQIEILNRILANTEVIKENMIGTSGGFTGDISGLLD